MKKLIFLFTLSTISLASFAQGYEMNPPVIARLHLLIPGFAAEFVTSRNTSVTTDFNLGFLYRYHNDGYNESSNLYFIPSIRLEPRLYYNQRMREHMGRRTDYFSGQFVALSLVLQPETEAVRSAVAFGPMWGFQRTLGKHGYWNIGFGLGLGSSDGLSYVTTLGEFAIGFILNKKEL